MKMKTEFTFVHISIGIVRIERMKTRCVQVLCIFVPGFVLFKEFSRHRLKKESSNLEAAEFEVLRMCP